MAFLLPKNSALNSSTTCVFFIDKTTIPIRVIIKYKAKFITMRPSNKLYYYYHLLPQLIKTYKWFFSLALAMFTLGSIFCIFLSFSYLSIQKNKIVKWHQIYKILKWALTWVVQFLLQKCLFLGTIIAR